MATPDDAYEQLFPDANVPDAPLISLPPPLILSVPPPSLKSTDKSVKSTKAKGKSLSKAPLRDDSVELNSAKDFSKGKSKNEKKQGKSKKENDEKNGKKGGKSKKETKEEKSKTKQKNEKTLCCPYVTLSIFLLISAIGICFGIFISGHFFGFVAIIEDIIFPQ